MKLFLLIYFIIGGGVAHWQMLMLEKNPPKTGHKEYDEHIVWLLNTTPGAFAYFIAAMVFWPLHFIIEVKIE